MPFKEKHSKPSQYLDQTYPIDDGARKRNSTIVGDPKSNAFFDFTWKVSKMATVVRALKL